MHDTGRGINEAGEGLRVLLVDDDVDLCDSLAMVLRGEDIDAVTTHTGSKAARVCFP